MANRRMFAKTIVLSDAFLDMPLSARCLYFTLGMVADDDGFVGAPKAIMRQCGASQDDMLILLQKRYVLGFESGVIVIKHWKMNNYLQNDRRVKTTYLEELSQLDLDDKGAYTEKERNTYVPEPCIQNVYTGKDSIGKDSINKYNVCFEEFWKNYPRKKEKQKAYKAYLARLNSGYSESELLESCINYAAECEKVGREERYIKLGATFLSVNEPFVDYLDRNYQPMETKKNQKKQNKFSEGLLSHKYDFSELEKEAFGGL